MVAPHHGKQSSRFRELALLDVLDPRPIDANGNFMLAFASDRTCVTPDTPSVVDDKSKVWHWNSFPVVACEQNSLRYRILIKEKRTHRKIVVEKIDVESDPCDGRLPCHSRLFGLAIQIDGATI